MSPDAVRRSVPFGLYMGVLVASPALTAVAPDSFDARWLYSVQVGLAGLALVTLWRHFDELAGAEAPAARDWASAAAVGAAVFVLWINLDFTPLALGSASGFDPRNDGSVDWRLAVVRVAGATLVVPVMEELFWRSFIMRWLEHPRFRSVDPAAVGARALVISSAVFALEHHLWFAGLLAGLAYGWLYRRSRSLWAAVFAHAVTNGLLAAWVLGTGSWRFW